MSWIARNGYLNQSEMENNADIVIAYFTSQNVNAKTIAALLGNMQAESTINPLLEEVGGQGFGVAQWTPVTVLQNHCSALGISPYTDGDVQLQCLIPEITGNPAGVNEWYSSSGFISNYYNSGATADMIGITGQQFLDNSMRWEPDKLAILFMACYERPSYNPSINHYQRRKEYALEWYNYITQHGFVPRLDDTGIVGDFHYYSQNPFYISGYGMPNCTCYAFGRFWEIGDPSDTGAHYPSLPLSNAGQWFSDAELTGYYLTGQTPRLGSVICFSDNNGGSGHVAIVEEIAQDGTITCSNSAYNGTFFFLTYITPVNGRYDWSHYSFQGFIYNPYTYYYPPTPSAIKIKKFPWVLYARKFRNRRQFL